MMKEKVWANISVLNLNQLREHYKKIDIDKIIEKKVKYYRLKPFQSRTKEIWIEKIKDYIQLVNTDFPEEEAKEKKSKENYNHFDALTKRGQIEGFWKFQPFYYDKSNIFWLWDVENKKWEISDEIEYLNSIQKHLGVETIDGKAKSQYVNGFKQVGRKHKPKEIKNSWVQFKDKIYDIKSGESFNATPEYFVKNPIPWKIGESEETPMMDELFGEWVEEKSIPTLYEIMGSSITPDKFMQRIIALVGGGSNGKGTFVKMWEKFLGEENFVSSGLKLLSENQFETAVIYGKLIVVCGEVSYGDLSNTNTIKQLSGEDKMRYCFKGKMPFTDKNTALAVVLTNSLPTTPDKSLGFYRRWLIIDFINQFKEITENLIDKIPDEEYENLGKKCLRILKELYNNPKFTNEGDFEKRAERYEERSNPTIRFLESHCEEIDGEYIPLRKFANQCNIYLKERHLRVLSASGIGKVLRNEGFSVSQRKINGVSNSVVLNLKFNQEPLKPLKPSKFSVEPYREPIEKNDGSDGFNGSQGKNDFTEEELNQADPSFRELLEKVV